MAAAVERKSTEQVTAMAPVTSAENQARPKAARVSSHSGATRMLERSTPSGPERKPVRAGASKPRQPKARPAINQESSADAATRVLVKSAMVAYFEASTFQRATGRVSSILMVPPRDSEETRSVT